MNWCALTYTKKTADDPCIKSTPHCAKRLVRPDQILPLYLEHYRKQQTNTSVAHTGT